MEKNHNTGRKSKTEFDKCSDLDHKSDSSDMQVKFLSVLQQLKDLCKDKDITTLREHCVNNMEQIFSLQFKRQIQDTNTSDQLIDLLNSRGYYTCLELRHISMMVKNCVTTSDIPKMDRLIEEFKNSQHKRKICELNKLFLDVTYPDCTPVTVKLNLQSQITSIEDLTDCCTKLEKIAGLPDGSYTLQSFEVDKGIKITFIIASDYYSEAYIRTKDNYIELRPLHIRYIQFDSPHPEKIFANQLTMTKASSSMLEKASTSCVAPMPPSQVIHHYYTYLENFMDPDSVAFLMHSECLLDNDDYKVITAAPNDLKMNCFLLEYIMGYSKLSDMEKLFKFCEVLKSTETQNCVGEKLYESLRTVSLNYHSTNDDESTSKGQLGIESNTSNVHFMLMSLIDKLFDTKILNVLAENKYAKPILACTNPEIRLCSDEYLKKLAVVASSKCLSILKIYLLQFVSWFNFSVLSELVKESGDENANTLLTIFESQLSHIDDSKSIEDYPLAIPSYLMFPNNNSFSFVVTKYKEQIQTLSDIKKIQDLLTSKWKITSNAIQLVTVKNVFAYWMIPTCVKTHIEDTNYNAAIQYELWQNGIDVSSTFLPVGLSDSTSISDALNTEEPLSFLGDIAQSSLHRRFSAYNTMKIHHNLQSSQSVIKRYKRQVTGLKTSLYQEKSNKDDLESQLEIANKRIKLLAKPAEHHKQSQNQQGLVSPTTEQSHSYTLDAEIKVRHTKVLFCGPPKTGKTTTLHCFKNLEDWCNQDDDKSEKVIIIKEGELVDFLSKIDELIENEKRNNEANSSKQGDTRKRTPASCTNILKSTTWNILILQDIGCQPELINVLPGLNDSATVSFVILNISDGEKGLDKPIDTPNDKNYRKHGTKCSTKYLLKRLLTSIKEFSNKEYTPETKQSGKIHTTQPHILRFLGNIIDNLENSSNNEDSLVELKYRIQKWCEIIGNLEHLPLNICGYDGEELIQFTCPKDEQKEIAQTFLSKALKALKDKDAKDIPLTWVKLESHLHEHSEKICFSIDEIKSLAKVILPNEKVELQIHEFLRFYHSFGTILYFEVDGLNKYAITNPQCLREKISKLVTCKFVEKKEHNNVALNELRYKGMFDINLLNMMDLDRQGIKKEYFIKLLIHLKICAPYEKHYFMPIVLESCGGSNEQLHKECEQSLWKMVSYKSEKDSIEVQPLLLKFEVNIIPRGMFCLLVTQLKEENPKWRLYGENIPHKKLFYRFSNMVTFSIDDYETYYLSIIDKAFYLRIHAYVRSECKISPPYYKIQKAITKSLESISDKFGSPFNEIQYGFFCYHKYPLESTKHLSFIPKCENFENAESAKCNKDHTMKLEEHHMVWLKDVELKLDDETMESKSTTDSSNDDFSCSATADKLKKKLGALSKLNYGNMMGSLIAEDVITDKDRKIIDDKVGQEKMIYLVLDIIIPSLKLGYRKKYKGFLKAMEESDDSDLNDTADNFGGSSSIPD